MRLQLQCGRGALQLAGDYLRHGVAALIACPRCERSLVGDDGLRGFVQAQQIPAGRFVVAGSAADLPDSRDRIVVFGKADIVNLDQPRIAVIAKLEHMPERNASQAVCVNMVLPPCERMRAFSAMAGLDPAIGV